MGKFRNLAQSIKNKRLLLSQVLFTALAFLIMVILSHYFVSGIVNNGLMRYGESVFSYAQAQIEYDLEDSENSLNIFSRSIRLMIMGGSDIETVREYIYDMSDFLHAKKSDNFRTEDLMEDMFVYIEAYPGDPIVISSFGWEFPRGQDPSERLWYQAAEAAGDKIAITAPFASLRSGELVITFARCIYDDDGRRLGIACMNIHIAEIGEKIVDIAREQEVSHVAIINRLKKIYVRLEKLLG